jgi:hypothetical protein
MVDLNQISAVEIAEMLSLQKGKGSNYHCFNSIAHNNGDKNPSLSILEDGFYCHGCRVKGGKLELVKQVLDCDHTGAWEWINKTFGFDDSKPEEIQQKSPKKLHLRLIRSDNFRFEFVKEDQLILKEATPNDIQEIKKNLKKSYSVETLNKAGVKINHSSGKYAMVFPNGELLYNPGKLDCFLHLEGRTDWLTAIRLV